MLFCGRETTSRTPLGFRARGIIPEREDHIPAPMMQPGKACQKLAIAPVQAGAEPSLAEEPASHR